jgi:hypothetical protein
LHCLIGNLGCKIRVDSLRVKIYYHYSPLTDRDHLDIHLYYLNTPFQLHPLQVFELVQLPLSHCAHLPAAILPYDLRLRHLDPDLNTILHGLLYLHRSHISQLEQDSMFANILALGSHHKSVATSGQGCLKEFRPLLGSEGPSCVIWVSHIWEKVEARVACNQVERAGEVRDECRRPQILDLV